MLWQFFLGFVKIDILHHAAQEPVYGTALMAELCRHGYTLSPGTLYPILHSLERAGYLSAEERVVAERVRKYYTITTAGQQALADLRPKIAELVAKVLTDSPPDHTDRTTPGRMLVRWRDEGRRNAVHCQAAYGFITRTGDLTWTYVLTVARQRGTRTGFALEPCLFRQRHPDQGRIE